MKAAAPLALLICLSGAVSPHDEDTTILRKAVHCLAAKNFLPSAKAPRLTFGYMLDQHSYPGEKMLYVVNYPDASRRRGFVFTVFLSSRHGSDFNVQNNARFTFDARTRSVDFTEAPLGGGWTQQHIMVAIRRIERRRVTVISTKSLLATDRSVRCEAYTDPQPKA